MMDDSSPEQGQRFVVSQSLTMCLRDPTDESPDHVQAFAKFSSSHDFPGKPHMLAM